MHERKISMKIPEGNPDHTAWTKETIAKMQARANEIMKQWESRPPTRKEVQELFNQMNLESLENVSEMQEYTNRLIDRWIPKMAKDIHDYPEEEKQTIENTQNALKEVIARIFRYIRIVEHGAQEAQSKRTS
jgi:DNA-directed RNA polymerase specialized sigma subunit